MGKKDQFSRNNQTLNFDFDEWASLYRNDPEAFEKRRQDWCSETINRAPETCRRRLSGLMFQINMEKRRAPNAMKSCLRLSMLMWDKFHELKDELHNLTAVQTSALAVPEQTQAHDVASSAPRANRAEVIRLTGFHPVKGALAKSGGS